MGANGLRTRAPAAAVLLLAVPTILGATPGAHAADQTVMGAGNAEATALARSSPLVQSAMTRLQRDLATVGDRRLRDETADALFNPHACIHHRANLAGAGKQAILDQLRSAGLYAEADAAAFPGGTQAGVFPPVGDDEQPCPRLPQSFGTAPGSNFGGHGSFPGGLAIHEGFNLSSALSFAENYQLAYGTLGPDGLPVMPPIPSSKTRHHGDLDISLDEIKAAPMWHDWAKTLVFQWNADGTEFAEFNFGGNGMTDNYGRTGDSRTGGHHVLSLAEAIARGLPPRFIVAQASAHSAPTLGNEFKVVNWIRAAAIVAQVDPVAHGLLAKDSAGNLRLPARGGAGQIDLNAAGQVNVTVEDAIHNLSDADFVFSIPAVTESQVILQALAPRYGYDPADAARYTTKFRNPVLSFLSGERMLILYTSEGLDAVQAEVDLLRQKGVI